MRFSHVPAPSRAPGVCPGLASASSQLRGCAPQGSQAVERSGRGAVTEPPAATAAPSITVRLGSAAANARSSRPLPPGVCTWDWQGPGRTCQPISQTRIKAPSMETAAAAQLGLLSSRRAQGGFPPPIRRCPHPALPPRPLPRRAARLRPLPEISLAICGPDAILRLRSHRLPAGLHAGLPGGAHLESANPTLGSPVSCRGGGPAPCTSLGSSNSPGPGSALPT